MITRQIDRRSETGHPRDTDSVLEARYWLTEKAYAALEQLELVGRSGRRVTPPPEGWFPALVELVQRRPDLAGIGYADLAREVTA